MKGQFSPEIIKEIAPDTFDCKIEGDKLRIKLPQIDNLEEIKEEKNKDIRDEMEFIWRIAFLHSEVSGMFKSMMHVVRELDKTKDDEALSAYLANARAELGDLIVQAELMADFLGVNFDDARKEGWKKYIEARGIWEEKGRSEKWR